MPVGEAEFNEEMKKKALGKNMEVVRQVILKHAQRPRRRSSESSLKAHGQADDFAGYAAHGGWFQCGDGGVQSAGREVPRLLHEQPDLRGPLHPVFCVHWHLHWLLHPRGDLQREGGPHGAMVYADSSTSTATTRTFFGG